jgi:hypothetical protein
VAHGTERVIDDIREHAYQISVMLTAIFFCIISLITSSSLVLALGILHSCIFLVWCANTMLEIPGTS